MENNIIYLWNQVSKKEKLEIIIKYFKIYNFDMDINISLYILKNFMKPNLNNNYNKLFLSNFPIYFGCEKIFSDIINISLTRCNGCYVRTNSVNDIIKYNNEFYNVCYCGKNYCLECFNKFFGIQNKIKCRGCLNINTITDINKNKSGILPFDLSKQNFKFIISKYLILIDFYHTKLNYMYGKKKIYTINLDINNYNYNKIIKDYTINDLKNKIIRLKGYYNEYKYKKIIIFYKFYSFVNQLLRVLQNDFKLKENLSYNNPTKMLELFIVFESIIKYKKN